MELWKLVSMFIIYQTKSKLFKRKKFKAQINISDETELLLDTGGGVFEGTKNFNDNPFFVINPDTVWSKVYLEEIKKLEEVYFQNNKPSLITS